MWQLVSTVTAQVSLEDGRYVLDFWGKARPMGDNLAALYHPIAFHSLDVAACALEILKARPLALARGADLLGLQPQDALRLIVALTALHDLGKFGKAFQSKRSDLWPSALGSFQPAAKSLHTSDGYLLWNDGLSHGVAERLWPAGGSVLHTLAPAIFGHHGRPVVRTTAIATHVLGEAGVLAANTCAFALLDLLHPAALDRSVSIPQCRATTASWWVAGLVTLADWVGSHEDWFEYHPVDSDASLANNLAAYWEVAKQHAGKAVRQAGLQPPSFAPRRSFEALTGINVPSPAQAWASKVELPDGPVLIILEDVTGAGKTETAQMLVHRLMSDGRASGAYWAMPTQATANAMYGRQHDAIAKLFVKDSDRRPSLALAHGQARLHDGFRASVLGMSGSPTTSHRSDPADTDTSSTVACAAFLADDRRTSLLADVGAGTIDQAILGVLPSRFNALRLFGLSDKVLVIDEAHAYDAYVSTELEALLRFHSALGGSAIVLSATLANGQRMKLIDAWLAGLPLQREHTALFGPPQPTRTLSSAYPLATIIAVTSVITETPLTAAGWSNRTVTVRFVHEEQTVLEEIKRAATAGAAVAWVRNTVGDCVRAAQMLRERGIDPIIFHARFAQSDRQAREKEVLHLFGKEASDAQRRGRVLVATQVIEQSLDLDFDTMFSDVAPVDLLIQRAGRLWRHVQLRQARPPGVRCELVILAPPMDDNPSKEWLKSLLPGTNAVYADTGVMWRTVRALARSAQIETPGTMDSVGGLRSLVEAVYGDDRVPPGLEDPTLRAIGNASAATATARYGTLKVADGYHGAATGWVNDIRVPTRLGKEQTTVRLARAMPDGMLEPWADADDAGAFPPWKRWALSEVRLGSHRIPREAVAGKEFDAAVASARSKWGRYEQEIPVLPLVAGDGDVWTGVMFFNDSDKIDIIDIRYSKTEGLTVE